MKIKPLADRVLVKNDKAETKTAGGLIIPEAAQEKTQTAVVVEVGPGTDEVKITLKKGDRIMYDKYAGTPIKTTRYCCNFSFNKDALALSGYKRIAYSTERRAFLLSPSAA